MPHRPSSLLTRVRHALNSSLFLSTLLALGAGRGEVRADSALWNGSATSGSFSDPTSWLTFAPPQILPKSGDTLFFSGLASDTIALNDLTTSAFNIAEINTYGNDYGLSLTIRDPGDHPFTLTGDVSNRISFLTIDNRFSFSGMCGFTMDSGTIDLSRDIDGAGGLTMVNDGGSLGTVILEGTDTYSGATIVNVGMLNLTGTLSGGSAISTSGGGFLFETDAGSIRGASSLTVGGVGTSTLGGTNTYTGGTTINAGATLQLGYLGLTTGSIIGNVTDNGAFVIVRPGNMSFDGVISGTGYLAVAGQKESGQTVDGSIVTLTATNTYTGGSAIAAGSTLQIGNGGTTGSIIGIVGDNGALVFNRSDNFNFDGAISGIGSLTVVGGGIVTLTAASTYSGGTTINAGATLQLGNGGATGSIAGNVTDNGTFAFNRTNNFSFDGVISGGGSVTAAGSAIVTLTATNTYTGGTTINNGSTLQLGGGGTTGSITGNVTDNGTFAFNRTNNFSFDGVISGGGSVTAAGSAIVTLTATNTYTGGTTINNGSTLQLGNGGATGAIPGNVTDNGTFALNRSGNFGFEGVISGTGSLSVAGGGTVTLTATNTYTGTTTIVSGTTLQLGNGGATGSIAGNVINNQALVINRSGNLGLGGVISGGGTITMMGGGVVTLAGANTYTGGTNFNGGVVNAGSASALGSTGPLRFGGGTLQYSAANQSDYSARFSSAAGQAYRIDTNGQSVTFASALTSNGGTLAKLGAGTLTLSGNSTFSGGTTVSQGTLVLNSSTAAGGYNAGAITLGDASTGNSNIELDFASGITGTDLAPPAIGGVRQMNPILVANTGSSGLVTLGFTGATPILYSDVTLNRSLVFTSNSTTRLQRSYMGQLSGSGAGADHDSVVFNLGAGNWLDLYPKELPGGAGVGVANTFTGNLLVQSGNLEVSNLTFNGNIAANENLAIPDAASVTVNTGATLQFVWGSETFDALNGGGTVQHNTADNQTNKTLTIGKSDGSGSFSGIITSDLGIIKTGAGTQIFSGNNVYSGGTTISGGTLQLGNGGASGSVLGNITNNGTLVFKRSDDYTFDYVISGSGGVVNDGNILRFAVAQTYMGSTQINSGTLVLPTGIDSALAASTVVTVNAPGRLDLSNHAQTFAGLVGSGTVYSFGGSSGKLTLNVAAGQTSTFSGVLGAAGDPASSTFTVTKAGPGTQILSGANGYLQATTVTGGTLEVDGSITASPVVSVSVGGTLSGDGRVSKLTGAGLVAPGGGKILTATQLDPASGLDFTFKLALAGMPNFASAATSGNDVLHLTDPTTPFLSPLTAADVITLDFSGVTLAPGQTYLGGFFLDAPIAPSFFDNATFAYTGLNSGASLHYNGLVAVPSANFATGTVNGGQIMEFSVVPEPATAALTLLGGLALGLRRRQKAVTP